MEKIKTTNPDIVIYGGQKWFSSRVVLSLFPNMRRQRLVQIRNGNSRNKTLLINWKMQEGVHYIRNVINKKNLYYSLKGIEFINNHTNEEPAFDLNTIS